MYDEYNDYDDEYNDHKVWVIENHLGGVNISNEEPDDRWLYCEECGDSDTVLGRYDLMDVDDFIAAAEDSNYCESGYYPTFDESREDSMNEVIGSMRDLNYYADGRTVNTVIAINEYKRQYKSDDSMLGVSPFNRDKYIRYRMEKPIVTDDRLKRFINNASTQYDLEADRAEYEKRKNDRWYYPMNDNSRVPDWVPAPVRNDAGEWAMTTMDTYRAYYSLQEDYGIWDEHDGNGPRVHWSPDPLPYLGATLEARFRTVPLYRELWLRMMEHSDCKWVRKPAVIIGRGGEDKAVMATMPKHGLVRKRQFGLSRRHGASVTKSISKGIRVEYLVPVYED